MLTPKKLFQFTKEKNANVINAHSHLPIYNNSCRLINSNSIELGFLDLVIKNMALVQNKYTELCKMCVEKNYKSRSNQSDHLTNQQREDLSLV